MINDQQYITTELKKVLEKMLILSSNRLNNLIAVVIGIIVSRSVILSDIAQELKDHYCKGTEESKIKRLQHFLSNELIDPESMFEFFAYKLLKDYKNNRAKYLYDIKLTSKKYNCNMAVCKEVNADDTWYIANNINKPIAIREYKKRFDIEEMFKDFKGGGFNLEDTWNQDIYYIRMMYLCISIVYYWIITLGTSCTKDKKNKLLDAVKYLKGKKVRIYSLFRSGYKYFKRCYYSNRSEYYLKIAFTLYES
ncbi:hypothetical protein [uncultured Clostridium sp.]|uniref:hypothetical protein n=1 Tax=uncultured Clostridium sp. TaxID=59620 RepID=UPI0028E97D15|nr:hypothetical protein [uncultured Clostridium sp.]